MVNVRFPAGPVTAIDGPASSPVIVGVLADPADALYTRQLPSETLFTVAVFAKMLLVFWKIAATVLLV